MLFLTFSLVNKAGRGAQTNALHGQGTSDILLGSMREKKKGGLKKGERGTIKLFKTRTRMHIKMEGRSGRSHLE